MVLGKLDIHKWEATSAWNQRIAIQEALFQAEIQTVFLLWGEDKEDLFKKEEK